MALSASNLLTIGNAIVKSLITAKGQILVGTGNATVDTLTPATNNYVLTLDDTTATGLKWALSTNATADTWYAGGAFTRASDSSFTVTDNATNQGIFVESRPIRYRETAGSWVYGIITNYSSGTVTISGAPMTSSYDDELQYSDMTRVYQWNFFISGVFANTSSGSMLDTLMFASCAWNLGESRLVEFKHRSHTIDTGANQPRVNVSVDDNKICTANSNAGTEVAQSWISTEVYIDTTNYIVKTGSIIEITTDANGSNKDAANLSLEGIFVML